jgi:glycopeptide antibiotics resistance protein
LIKIAPDKWKHFFIGILMGATLQISTGYLMPEHHVVSIITTFILVIVISYGFELFSLVTKKGHYDILDAVAGIIGGMVGMIIILPFEYL